MTWARAIGIANFLLIFGLFVVNGQLLAAPAEVIITHASMSTTAIPLWVAQRQNFFGKYGVKPKSVWVRSNPTQIATLASGDTQIAYGGATTALAAAVGGKELKIVPVSAAAKTWIWWPGPASTTRKTCAASASASRVSAAASGRPLRFGLNTSAWMKSEITFR